MPIDVGARGDPVQRMRDQYIDAQMSTPAVDTRGVSGFLLKSNAATGGVDVTFKLTSTVGIKLVTLHRATVMDFKQATVLQTWAPKKAAYAWADTDAALKRAGQAFYWVSLSPVNFNGVEEQVGPQYILLNPSLLPPLDLGAISASHAAVANGVVLVTCNVSAIPTGEYVKIYVSGYNGNAAFVALAERVSAPLQFNLEQTGETVTFKAIATSSGGTEAASGPTCTLVLGSAATVPAQVQNVAVDQIATGNQVSWPSSIEAGVTGYLLYRGIRNSGFGLASHLATISATSIGTVIYLDTAGLTGDWEYYVICQSGAGNSPQSLAANPQVLYSSSQVPGNSTSNTANQAFLDSVDAGSSATVRIYGSGGVGTTFFRHAGYGSYTRPAGSVTGLAYTQRYYILFDTAGQVYLASTTYSDSLPDGYEWVGTLVTVAAGGTGGGGAGGSGAAASAIISSGTIAATNMTSGGYGYGTATVAFAGGSPSRVATGLANCSGGAITNVQMTDPGSGYLGTPAVVFTSTSPYTGGGGNTNGGQRYVVTT